MKALRFGRTAAALSITALALTACTNPGDGEGGDPAGANGGGGEGESQVSGTLLGGGASSQEAAMTSWSNNVGNVHPDLTINYEPVGSGSGREGFINGAYSFAGSDAAMDSEEQAQTEQLCGPDGVFHVPAYISPVAVAYNLPGVDNVNMDADTIAAVFTGEISTWNDPQIADQNPDVELPDLPITVVHRADDSGTTENFTEYLDAASETWDYGAVEAWPSDIAAESAQQTSGVVSLTGGTEGAITYADASQVGDLGTVAVQVGEEYVPYSSEAAARAVETAEESEEAEGAVELDRTNPEEGVYPIVLVSYHIYCHNYATQETADQASAFGEYVVSEEGQTAAEEAAGSAPIADTTREAAMERLSNIGVQE